MTLTRRQLLICAAAGGVAALAPPARGSVPVRRWRGFALGAQAEIVVGHADTAAAERLLAAALDEIARLEAVFSLYRGDSALSRLNRTGDLRPAPFELLELLSTARALHARSGGAFDPTVQPLWKLYADHAGGPAPSPATLRDVRARVGLDKVAADAGGIRFARAGMGLTFNGIAQGYITDRVVAIFRRAGLDSLVSLGEAYGLGRSPDGDPWRTQVASPEGRAVDRVALENQALATSAPRALRFGGAGAASHILHPRTGLTPFPQRLVSVRAPSATLADGLSTALAVMERAEMAAVLRAYPDAAALLAEGDGPAAWLSPPA